jgi:transposase
MYKQRRVVLTIEQRTKLEKLICSSDSRNHVVTKARILLMADRSQGQNVRDIEIIKALGKSICTIARARRLFCEKGLDAAIGRKPRSIDNRNLPELRRRAIELSRDNIDYKVICKQLNIARSTLLRWLQLYAESGDSLFHIRLGRRPRSTSENHSITAPGSER